MFQEREVAGAFESLTQALAPAPSSAVVSGAGAWGGSPAGTRGSSVWMSDLAANATRVAPG